MKVPKEQMTGEINQILWPAPKVRKRLDEFGEKNPEAKRGQGDFLVPGLVFGMMESEPQSKK